MKERNTVSFKNDRVGVAAFFDGAREAQAPQNWKPLFPLRNRHRFQRIVNCRPAIATHLVAVTLDREHSAQLPVMTPLGNFQSIR